MITDLSLIEKAKKYLINREKYKSIYHVIDSENYLSSWAVGTLGYLRLLCLHENKLISKKLFNSYIRNLICLGYQQELCFQKSNILVNYKDIVISWCMEKDFLKNGSFQCRYFNCNSNNSGNILWVLLALDNFIPASLSNNIIICFKKEIKRFSVCNFVKNVLFCLWNRIPYARESLFVKKFADLFIDQICINNINKLLIPYEAQPWQHMLFLALKKKNKKIRITGDLHSCLPPFPSDFIKRYGAPNKVLVHGSGQKDIMVNMLGWSKNDIEIVSSRRFIKNHNVHLVNKILLPYSFGNSDFILKTLGFLFQHYGSRLPLLEIRNHPVQADSQQHKKLIKDIITLQDKHFYSFNTLVYDKISVVIGASSAIIECLTHGIKVFQIVENSIFDTYSPKIWKNLKINCINQNIVEYDLCERINYLEFGNNSLQEVFADD